MADAASLIAGPVRPLDRLLSLAVWASACWWQGASCGCWAISCGTVRAGCRGPFSTSSLSNAGSSGGIGPILVSTLLILGVALAVAVPLGLATAVLLAEFLKSQSRFGRLVGLSLDVLAGVPSIVFGLFGNAFFCVFLGLGFSILSGGLTLACMVLPILIRTAEAGLRAVPDDWRLGCAALGLSRAAALRQILLPAASSGLVAGLMLGIGRAMAETAALIFTSGYVDRMPSSLDRFRPGALGAHLRSVHECRRRRRAMPTPLHWC